MKSSFLGKVVERAEQLSREELLIYFSRLARENGLLETVFGALKEGVIVLDSKGEIEYLNSSTKRLLPIPSELPDRPFMGNYLKDLPWDELISKKQAQSRMLEIDYPEHRILELSLLPIELPSEEKLGAVRPAFVCIFHDVTKQHAKTQEVLESERLNAITMLAAGVAHELGNPINNLNIHLQLIERDIRNLAELERARMEESIGVARLEIKRLDTIIHEFLQAIRPTVPDFNPVDLEVTLKTTLHLLEQEISNQNLLVESEVEEDLPLVMGDEGQLKQAFYNLIKNAIQAMENRGILAVRMVKESRWVKVEFRDNGEGIAIENIPQVMEPFYTTKKRGTGLGLMIVQRIVREHGGELSIESHQGQGTTAQFRLPWQAKQIKLLQ